MLHFLPFFFGALTLQLRRNYAAVASDTFSSELGILSKNKPRLITAPWRVVPPGTNGGVTLTGLLAGLFGALIIAVTSTALLPFCQSWTVQSKLQYTFGVTLAGFCGTLLDSYLGAVLQASVVDTHSGKVVEGDGGRKVLVHSTAVHLNTEAKLRTKAIKSEHAEEDVAKTSARDKDGGRHEGRKVEVGHDILDNNAVNFLMTALVSFGSMVAASVIWDVPFTSIISV